MSKTLSQKLLDVQKKIGALTKDSNNPFFKSKYADLNQVLQVAKEALLPEGLVIVQGPGISEAGRYIETTILDADTGQSIGCKVPFSGNEKNMQEIGAATTYGRRFGLVSLLALEQEDDDGETAVGRGPTNPRASVPTRANNDSTAKRVTKVNPPKGTSVGQEVQKSSTRETVNKAITKTAEFLVNHKSYPMDEIYELLRGFGVENKEQLTDEQAKTFLAQLEERLEA